MSPKTKILIVGLGIMWVNTLVLALYIAWPLMRPEVQRVAEEPVDTLSISGVPPVEESIDVETTSMVENVATPTAPSPISSEVKQTTHTDVGQVDRVSVPVYTEGSVLAAMEAYRAASGFTFAGKEYPGIGIFIDTVQGRKAEGEYYWMLYVNGKSSDLGASQAQVKPGDVVEWRYEDEYKY